MVNSEKREDLLQRAEQEYDAAVRLIENREYDPAFEHFSEAEQMFLQLQDQHWLTFLFHEKFRIFFQLKEFEQALALADPICDGYLDTNNQHGLALFQIHKADLLREMEDFYQALSCLRIAEAIIKSEKIDDLMGYLDTSLAVAFFSLNDAISALEYLKSAMQRYSMESSPEEFAWCLHQAGICLLQLFDFDAAERHLVGSYQAYFKVGNNEAGRDVIATLKEMYRSSNQIDKLAGLERIGKQKRF
jgi:tetratricopeptide (TPR) repeat protein